MPLRILLACVLIGLLAACARAPPPAAALTDQAHNSANSLDWAGRYEGITPCADCAGIETIVYLRGNGTFVLSQRYLDREVVARRSAGRFTWDATGRNVMLDTSAGPLRYQVGENQLLQLDREGRRIEGPNAEANVLHKRAGPPPDEAVAQLDGRWLLIELSGKPVPAVSAQDQPVELRFGRLAGRVSGYTGCNNLTGGFTAGPADRLQLQQLASTRRACIGPNVEDELLRVLLQVSRYTVKGNELQLLPESGSQPLARFRLAA